MKSYTNLSFHNQLSPGPSNGLTKYDLTEENFNMWRSMESGKTGMPDFKISLFQEKEYDAVAMARKSNGTEINKSCASHLNSASLNVQYRGNCYKEKRSKKNIHPYHKISKVCNESSALELQKIKTICEGL
ncbi:hypothetical protein CEXT_193941 [Caerostris extrusa]|uniref:Uncharacterized protein n=1 Tax=Caerostris extrusa TaxID=172846 RepID=A0AAV4URU4_CAEEX|nr:hypothetical protein CEXT_193941 [Caerostris extrusa]